MELNQVLRENRQKHELTQQQLADKLFVSNKTISNWETGKTLPDIESLIRLANLFNLSLDNLLLEGSDIVENIKKTKELRALKAARSASIITSICIMILISVTSSDESLLSSLAFIFIVFSNLVLALYIEKQMKYQKGK